MLKQHSLAIIIGTALTCAGCSKSSEPVTQATPASEPAVQVTPAASAPSIPESSSTVSPSVVTTSPTEATGDPAKLGETATTESATVTTPAGVENPHASSASTESDGGSGSELVGVVKSTIDVPDSKTMYFEIENNGQITWVASKSMEIKTGERVRVPAGGLIMENFASKSLGRTFDRLLMTSEVTKVE